MHCAKNIFIGIIKYFAKMDIKFYFKMCFTNKIQISIVIKYNL